MENIAQKAAFLKNEFTETLAKLDADAQRQWGKMNVQQMIEHMTDSVKLASGKIPAEVVTPEDKIPAMQSFMESDKPFKENTRNAMLPEEPTPVRNADKESAIGELQGEIDHFFDVHEKEADKKTANPFFGHLGFEQQVQLLYKHAIHHLKQFGAAE